MASRGIADKLDRRGVDAEHAERVARIMNGVSERLPVCDHQTARTLLSAIRVVDALPQDAQGLIVANDAAWYACTMLISSRALTMTDEELAYVMAHELAHVVLRHHHMDSPLGRRDGTKAIAAYQEDHADWQALLWGFASEMEVFYANHPGKERPAWYGWYARAGAGLISLMPSLCGEDLQASD